MDQKIERALNEAAALGICLTPEDRSMARALKQRLGAGITSPFKGLYVAERLWRDLTPDAQTAILAATLAKLHPTWLFTSFTAASLCGLSVSWRYLTDLSIGCPGNRHPRVPNGIRIVRINDSEPWTVNGISITCPHQTLLTSMCRATFPDALAIIDSALRRQLTDRERFARYIDTFGYRHRGISTMRRALHHADAKSENGGESIARAAMIEEGFQIPQLQVAIRDPVDPWRSYRADFFWQLPNGRYVIGEHDGKAKTQNPDMMQGRSLAQIELDERRRESHLTALGIQIMRFSPRTVENRRAFCRLLEAFGIPRVNGVRP